MIEPLCVLTSDGAEGPPEAAIKWRDRAICAVRQAITGAGPLRVVIWPYRDCGATYLVCDVFAQDPTVGCYGITICVGGPPDMKFTNEPTVPDMADALHLATLLANELGAKVSLGQRMTREVSSVTISEPELQTPSNAPMRLATLIQSIESIICAHGYRLGVDRRHEVSLPIEVRRRVAEQLIRDWESGQSDGLSSDQVSLRIQRLDETDYFFQLVADVLQTVRDAGRYVVRDYRPFSESPQGAPYEKA